MREIRPSGLEGGGADSSALPTLSSSAGALNPWWQCQDAPSRHKRRVSDCAERPRSVMLSLMGKRISIGMTGGAASCLAGWLLAALWCLAAGSAWAAKPVGVVDDTLVTHERRIQPWAAEWSSEKVGAGSSARMALRQNHRAGCAEMLPPSSPVPGDHHPHRP